MLSIMNELVKCQRAQADTQMYSRKQIHRNHQTQLMSKHHKRFTRTKTTLFQHLLNVFKQLQLIKLQRTMVLNENFSNFAENFDVLVNKTLVF